MTDINPNPQIDNSQNPLIVIASNRGPYRFELNDNGQFVSKRGAGGLVTALAALAEQLDVLWIASALSETDKQWATEQNNTVTNVDGINLRLVVSDDEAYHQFYNIIANPLLWFIQHGMWDMTRNPIIEESTWQAWDAGYLAINRQFSKIVVDSVEQVLRNDPQRPVIIFPQDYHLYLLPHFLREALGQRAQIQPFIHIPWPGPDGWRILPRTIRDTLLKSLLVSDRIGFQTRRDAFNFVQTARFYVEGAHSHGSRVSIEYEGHTVQAKAYPISVDVEKLESLVSEGQARLHKNQLLGLVGDRKLILRVDRVEPSKNILRGLQAYRTLLEEHPEHHGAVVMMALLVPSRMKVDEYQIYLRDIMAEAGMINAEFSDEFWQPVSIILGNNYPRALAAMQLYDVLLVNPIADGMNLVAKEGALVNQRDGVLLLSEHAGAFYELGDYALTVSPFDVYSTANAMHDSLTMPYEERAKRAEELKTIVRKAGVKAWFFSQVQDALQASNNQDKKASTPETPATNKSDESRTKAGVSSDSTPIPKEKQ